MTYDQDEQDGLRARSEQAIGELAQALIDNPTLHNAISAAFEEQIDDLSREIGALRRETAKKKSKA